ncbi:MAG: hypothetical protein JXR96_18850, partial [Deltaproteobacteria bacterium]|nr:hypothetical protein [Deltaproteobacteria bacterium]
ASLCSILPRWISIDGHFAVLRKIERSDISTFLNLGLKPQALSPRCFAAEGVDVEDVYTA